MKNEVNLRQEHPFILLSSEIYDYFTDASNRYPNFIKTTNLNPDIPIERLNNSNSTQTVEINHEQTHLPYYSILFGEHARELVSADLSVRFTQ